MDYASGGVTRQEKAICSPVGPNSNHVVGGLHCIQLEVRVSDPCSPPCSVLFEGTVRAVLLVRSGVFDSRAIQSDVGGPEASKASSDMSAEIWDESWLSTCHLSPPPANRPRALGLPRSTWQNWANWHPVDSTACIMARLLAAKVSIFTPASGDLLPLEVL